MEWVADTYVIAAGDLALAYTGRAWCAERKRWESVHSGAMAPGTPAAKPLILRGIDVRAMHASGTIMSGIRIMLMLVTDPRNPSQVMILADDYQSASKVVSWMGKVPLCAGVQWRIHAGSFVAGDYVGMGVSYE